jgi:molybdopterin converting factor subunit 1
VALQIHTFGITRDITGTSNLQWPLNEPITVANLMQALFAQYPALAEVSSILVAVNEEYAAPNQQILPTDTVALIPPVSGG